ncbi:PAS domain-containing protein [Lichenibacterium dinghuense]|uniref:PAS domain-containing protein n=1 Tax=Lichenibacterium dinghuense TaxID=2895977 RepID=UPI001F31FC4E|nr:PAS domain-containing protein [Lichenibacterium sp. 6Y81]
MGSDLDGRGTDILFAALEAAPMPLVLSDPNRPDDPIVFANRAFGRMTGYGRAEVLGRNCRFLQGPGTDPGAVDLIRRGLRAREEVAVEILNYRRDGTPFRNALSIAPVFDAAGGLVYFLGFQADVSRRPEAGEAPPRTISAEAGGRALGDLAHDLNNMLQVIAGHVDGLKDHVAASGDARLVRRMRAVSEAADRATGLVRRILDGARGPGAGTGGTPAPDGIVSPPRVGGVGPEPAVGRGGERILVVDDRPEVAELARTMLEGAGYGVEVARDGRDALEKLRGGFALLFSDVVMPGDLDGVALAREAQRRHPGLKVLLTTGQGAGPARAEFEAIGKPYRRSELAEAVRRLLDAPGGGA